MIVGILRVSTSPVAVRLKLLPCFLEWVGNVLEENEPEHDVFGLGGVHVTAERVGHAPHLSLIANQSPIFNVLLGRQVKMPSREMRLREWQTLYQTLPYQAKGQCRRVDPHYVTSVMRTRSRINTVYAAIPNSRSLATRYSCGRSPLTLLQYPHSS